MIRLAAATVSALALAAPAVAETRSYDDLPAFTGLEVSSGIDLSFATGGAQSVVAEGSQKALDKLLIEVDGDTLEVSRRGTNWWSGGGARIEVSVSAPQLSRLDVSSGADVEGSGLSGERVEIEVSSGSDAEVDGIDAGEARLTASSGADLEANGVCGRLVADASSGSDIEARGLRCTDVEATASSGADIEAYATGSLRASASSGSDVEIDGSPVDVETEKSSGGSVSVARAN